MHYDYYKILEIQRSASLDDIKKAYRLKAKLVHPDVNNSPKANEVFAVVNEAYEILTDERKRYIHDIKLNYVDANRAEAERKKHYYGSSVKNDVRSAEFQYDSSSSKGAYKNQSDEEFYKRSPFIYNMFFASGMFVGFLIISVTTAGTIRSYWPAPFFLINIPGIILVREGWRGMMGKRTMISDLIKKFRK